MLYTVKLYYWTLRNEFSLNDIINFININAKIQIKIIRK